MKRIISIVLALALLLGLNAELSAAAATNTSFYLTPLSTLCSKIDRKHPSSGFLYDLNKDGVKELVAFYANASDSYTHRFSVLTIKDNKAKYLCRDKSVLSATAPHECSIGTATKNGRRYVVVAKQFGSAAVSDCEYQKTEVYYYKYSGSYLKKVKTISLWGYFDNTVTPAKKLERNCKVGGEKVSYARYKKHLNSYKYSKLKTQEDEMWGYRTIKGTSSVSLPKFYKKLKG